MINPGLVELWSEADEQGRSRQREACQLQNEIAASRRVRKTLLTEIEHLIRKLLIRAGRGLVKGEIASDGHVREPA